MVLIECLLAFALAHSGIPVGDSMPTKLVDDAKRIVTFLNTGHADSVQARMTPEAQQRYTPTQRDSLWRVLVSQVGAFRRFGPARVEEGTDGGRTVVLELEFTQEPIRASVAYDQTGRIASIVLQSQ
ncbi:MAG TPA: DUF3887 domain-containing protein [Gemmatimonadaceae bacterium]|nr:DUF3887 domain-containing protein [Gemmatimonadaceae bacterium]